MRKDPRIHRGAKARARSLLNELEAAHKKLANIVRPGEGSGGVNFDSGKDFILEVYDVCVSLSLLSVGTLSHVAHSG